MAVPVHRQEAVKSRGKMKIMLALGLVSLLVKYIMRLKKCLGVLIHTGKVDSPPKKDSLGNSGKNSRTDQRPQPKAHMAEAQRERA